MVHPPDSLNVEAITLPGEQAWEVAVRAALGDDEAAVEAAAAILRRVAGYD